MSCKNFVESLSRVSRLSERLLLIVEWQEYFLVQTWLIVREKLQLRPSGRILFGKTELALYIQTKEKKPFEEIILTTEGR